MRKRRRESEIRSRRSEVDSRGPDYANRGSEEVGCLQARKRICDGDFRDHKELFSRRKIRYDESDTELVEIGLLESLRSMAKRRYAAHFVSKLTDCDGKNSETDSPLDFAKQCGYGDACYHGIQTMKSPLDFWIYQEILWETRPAINAKASASSAGHDEYRLTKSLEDCQAGVQLSILTT